MSESIDPVDQTLVELLEQKSPEELSFEELELLRQRLTESPALRVALAQYLQTESYLTQVLGNFSVSPETIITRAQAERAAQVRPWQWLAGGAVCLALFGVLAAVFVNALQAPAEHELAEAAKRAAPDVPDVEPAPPSPPVPDVDPAPEGPVEPPPPDKPVEPIANNNPPAEAKVAVLLPAERFLRGNVKVDNSQYGNASTVVVHSGGGKKTSVEYEFFLPRAGQYFLHLRYAADEARPVKLVINSKKLNQDFAKGVSGGLLPPQQKWFTEGQHAFKKGRNVLRLERTGPIPHLSRIVISTDATISDATAPQPPPAEIAQADPWDEALQDPNPPSYLATAFEDFDTSKSLPQVQDLLRWFETVPNQQRNIGDTHTKVGKCGEFNGVFRLRWPWQENAALRLSLENHNRLRLHFYNGLEGITLVYYQDEGSTWGAYVTTRKDAQTHLPETLALTATDNGRCARTEMRFGGPIDLRWHAGELILSRGDVVLLRAPLAALPTDVYFDGRTAFHGIAVVPSKDAPAREPLAPGQDITPASLSWQEKLTEGAKTIKHADGSLELSAESAKGSGYITTPLGQLAPSEIILELEGISRGTGVFLSPETPPSLLALRFATNPRVNPPALCAALRPDELREGDLGLWTERLTPHVRADKQYVRLLTGAGIVRCALSADGVHWAECETMPAKLPAGNTHLCLHYVSAEPKCRIKLNRITVRPLAALAAQVGDGNLLAKVPALNNQQTPTIGQWLAEVTTAQPANVAASVWRRTCAIRSLAAGCDAELGQRLVHLVLDDAEARQAPVEQLLALYRDAFLLLDTRHDAAQAQACWNRYFTTAALAAREGARPFSTVRHAAMTSPVSWRHNLPIGDEKTIRLELLQLLYTGQWEQTLDFCQMLRFYQQHQRVPLVDWAEATAVRQLPGRPGGETSLSRLRSNWRPMLVEELSKDAYNVLAEMQAILDSDAFEDAARMITSISPDAISGVAPHGRDRQLLVSLPSAIRLAVRNYPQLQQVMNEKFGPLAELRVRQSVNANNVAAVDLAAVQFEATEAAAEAHRWLGDRALSSGQFARALAEYDRAMRTASSTLKHDLEARMRLAAAMQGRDLGKPVTRPVSFGETNISPGEFEAIVADMKNVNAAAGAQRAVTADDQRTYPAPAPTGYDAAVRSRLDGPIGGDPNAEVTRDINALKINWAERQIATLVEGNVLYVSNRFQLAAYNLDNGQRMWQTAPIPGNAMRSRDWTLIAMRPLIVGNTLYARLLYGASPTLAAFEKSSGKLLWTSEQRHNEFLVSDPLLIQGQLLALTLVRGDQGQSSLRLTTFDRDSGEPVVQRSLVRLNDVWWTRRAAEVTSLADSLVATLGGVSLCCDASGNVRWIRRPIGLPPEEESSWVRQYFERPLLVGGRVLLAQPGVRWLGCVEAETGRLAWSHVMPDIESVVGALDDRLIVRTETAFVALRLADGEELWRHPRPEVFDAVLLGGPGGLLYVEREPTKANKDRFWPRLVWVDPATGLAKSAFAITTLEDADPHFGPLVSYKDRLFTFWGRSQVDPNRDVVELVPKAGAPLSPVLAAASDPWSRQTDTALRQPAERLFPDWPLLAGAVNAESGLRDDVFGEKEVLGICVRPNQPTLFVREFAPAAGSQPKLRLRFNHRTDQEAKVKLSVQFAGETVWSQEFGKDQAPQQWKDLEINLAPLAGKTGTLAVRADYVAPAGEMPTWWKRLELVP